MRILCQCGTKSGHQHYATDIMYELRTAPLMHLHMSEFELETGSASVEISRLCMQKHW